ncbi:MAG: hypothetical protein K8R08_10025 [Methanosarcinales archaeon]|nr:hypothetical protein [Methanosarcinales archaeon]
MHLDRENYRCTVWEQRPVPCQGFDCGNSKRSEANKINLDLQTRRINRSGSKGSVLI